MSPLDKPLTDLQLDIECAHIIENRLGVLCEDRDPTPEQRKIADDEAAQWRAGQTAKRGS